MAQLAPWWPCQVKEEEREELAAAVVVEEEQEGSACSHLRRAAAVRWWWPGTERSRQRRWNGRTGPGRWTSSCPALALLLVWATCGASPTCVTRTEEVRGGPAGGLELLCSAVADSELMEMLVYQPDSYQRSSLSQEHSLT